MIVSERSIVHFAENGRTEPDMISDDVFARAEILTRQERPILVFRRSIWCCGAASPEQPFVDSAAFSRLNRRSADNVAVRAAAVRERLDAEPSEKRGRPPSLGGDADQRLNPAYHFTRSEPRCHIFSGLVGDRLKRSGVS